MKNKYDEKIKELEKRIKELESKPNIVPTLPAFPMPNYPPQQPYYSPYPACWCGRNWPHTCVWC